MSLTFLHRTAVCLILSLASLPALTQTAPPDGLRDRTPDIHAFVNARIVTSPGKVIENGTMVIRDGIIESVGTGEPPAGAPVRDLTGLTIYPGLIDMFTDYGFPKAAQGRDGDDGAGQKAKETASGALHWNSQVMAQRNASSLFRPDEKSAEKLRSQGITAALAVPNQGIFRGTSALVHTGEGTANELIVRSKVAHHITFERDRGADGYPNSLMGAIALIRQTMIDADWYARAQAAYASDPSLSRPEQDEALASLGDILIGSLPVIFETGNDRDFFRANTIAQEFGFDLIVRGSGHEYKRLEAVAATGRSVILPLNFPKAPDVRTPESALEVSLEELRHWDEAPENPGRLQNARVPIALTASELKDAGSFLSAVRTAVKRGLPEEAALSALTSTPARLCGVWKQLGSLSKGKIADFVVTDGNLFHEKTKIRETWIDGRRYEVTPVPSADLRGMWDVSIAGEAGTKAVSLKGEPDKLKGSVEWNGDLKLADIDLSGFRLSFSVPGDSVGKPGAIRMGAVVSNDTMEGTGEWPDGSGFAWSGTRTGPYTPEPDTTKAVGPVKASFPPVYPPGAFGRASIPPQSDVLVRNATIWTCGPDGRLENADLLVRDGTIRAIGRNLDTPSGVMVIDGTGRHVTPGLIDAHSHMAADAINEAGQAITAEVRIGDVLDADDISIYRALAGGLTTAHILHGSANPIGGQSQLIKLRWGVLPEQLKFENAPPTIKFALGENVKQSNWGEKFTTRYPQTRMGVEQIMRDEFNAALAYEKAMSDKSGIPARRDLELDAILEIIHGKRFVHCHSYRQDEILATMRVAEDFGFRIRVFQHILEGYKVADIMAEHGAGGSTFSDWWAYKFEVYDAIPYNGALMHNEGVLVSYNSDSNELARRLNTEAAKAVKWGGLTEEEALRFVTINPARQLFIDDRVGSLEEGKDADFAIWNGNPLSTYTRCEQTWVDGRKFFDREEDRKMNTEVTHQRAVLIQKVLASGDSGKGGGKKSGGTDTGDHPYSCTDFEGGH
ncbi:MAG: amidohydrolase family protein [Ignavibacteria bacterium]|nr:amidohydrolase family protein [Ignavibacteria bacterium]